MEIFRKDNGFSTSIVEAALSQCGRVVYRQIEIDNDRGLGDGGVSHWSIVPPLHIRPLRPRCVRRHAYKIIKCQNVLTHAGWHFNADDLSCEDIHRQATGDKNDRL